MRLARYPHLYYAFEFGDRALALIPRCASNSIHASLIDAGHRPCKPDAIRGDLATVVRHPVTRLRSAYIAYRDEMTVAQFVDLACSATAIDVHVRKQSELVDPEYFIRFESLAMDWSKLCAWLGICVPTLYYRNPTPYTWDLTEYQKQQALDWYADDIEAFGY